MATFAAALVGVVVYVSTEKQDTVFLENAELAEPNYLDNLATKARTDFLEFDAQSPVSVHRLRRRCYLAETPYGPKMAAQAISDRA